MASTALAPSSVAVSTKPATRVSTRASRLAIVAMASYQLLLIVLIFLRPDLDPSWHTISEWAIGPHGWVMQAAFLVSAMGYAALLLTLRKQVRGIVGGIGLGLLVACAIGAAGAGIFRTDPMPFHMPLSHRGTLHVVFGTCQLVLLPWAALLINLSLARSNAASAPPRRVLLWTAGLPLAGFLGFAIYTAIFVAPLGPAAYGPGVNIGWPPRFAFFTYMVWAVTLAWRASRLAKATRSIEI